MADDSEMIDEGLDLSMLLFPSDENHANISSDFPSSPLLLLADTLPSTESTMDSEADAFLNIFDMENLASADGNRRGRGMFGTNSDNGTPPEFSDSARRALLHHHPTMDIGDFNIFGDKHPGNDGQREDSSMPAPPGTAQGNANNVNFDALQQLLSMQMQMQYPMSIDGSLTSPSQGASSNNANTSALLEQQLRLQQLQQLQQLQNQIFQQQIELISGQTSLSNSLEATPIPTPNFRDATQFQGLPTPANSTELRPQPPPSFVSPMILQNYLVQPGPATRFNNAPQHQLPQAPSSAPAHLAFSSQAPQLSPGDLDFDLSPLTSPWLGAVPYQQAQQQLQHQPQGQEQGQGRGQRESDARRGSKRGASSGAEEVSGQARKRHSGVVRAADTAGAAARKAASARGSASVGSTPAMQAQSSRNSIASEIVGDTPSPVDLSMPPPSATTQATDATSADTRQSAHVSSNGSALSPVTPASIMNLGRLGLGSGLSPPLSAVDGQQNMDKGKAKAKGKTPPKVPAPAPVSTSSGPATKSITKKSSRTSLISPSLKPLLPGGLAPSSAATLGSDYTHHLSGSATSRRIAPSSPLPPPTPTVRKSSHKAAEQKRRDSLKTTFDALRLLLPPLPLPSEEGYMGEVPLPGANPPRGPPRGDVQGPNRAVSKLQLLRAGNDFIRRLQGRVVRRDEYIELLRGEVRALRVRVEAKDDIEVDVGVDEVAEEFGKVDLEKDLDAEEANAPRLGGGPGDIGEEGDEEYE